MLGVDSHEEFINFPTLHWGVTYESANGAGKGPRCETNWPHFDRKVLESTLQQKPAAVCY